MPIPIPLIAAGLAGGSALAEGMISSAFNASQAGKQMRFQERMSNSAHQREVSDLRAAGLNPILSSKLAGSSSPPGASAQASSPDVAGKATHAYTAGVQKEMNQAQQAVLLAQTKDLNSSAALKESQRNEVNTLLVDKLNNIIAQTEASIASGNLSGAQKLKALQEIENLKVQKKGLEINNQSSAYQLERTKFLNRGFDAGNKAVDSAVKSVKEKRKSEKEWRDKKTPALDNLQRLIKKERGDQ